MSSKDNADINIETSIRNTSGETQHFELYSILLDKDGKEAIEHIEQFKPDLILTDIMMPFVSGLEVISHVRNKLNSQTPIIVFSSAGQEEIVLKAFDIGATDFMSKPFSPHELVIRVKRLFI